MGLRITRHQTGNKNPVENPGLTSKRAALEPGGCQIDIFAPCLNPFGNRKYLIPESFTDIGFSPTSGMPVALEGGVLSLLINRISPTGAGTREQIKARKEHKTNGGRKN